MKRAILRIFIVGLSSALCVGVYFGSEVQEFQTAARSAVETVSGVSNDVKHPPSLDADRISAAWRGWMRQNKIDASSLAVGFDGEILYSDGQKIRPDHGFPMASLTKAITGMCANHALENSPYTWSSTLRDLEPEFAKRNFTPNAAIRDLTLTQIATHTSGLPTDLDYGKVSARSRNLSSQQTMVRAALRVPANFGPRGDYTYSNANYAILGYLIEAMTEQTYEDYCKQKILEPAGVQDAVVGGTLARTAAYGGWLISAEDYARFATYWFSPERPWMKNPRGFAYDSSAQYGMGVSVYPSSLGAFVSHFGIWRHPDPKLLNVGALFFVRNDGLAVVVNWEQSLPHESYLDLHHRLVDAVH